MKSGQKRLSNAHHRLHGTYRADRHGPMATNPLLENLPPPEPPENLSERARKEWDRVLAESAPLGMITALDRAVLTQYCVLWSELEGRMAEGTAADFTAAKHTQLRMLAEMLGLAPGTERDNRLEHLRTETDADDNPFL